VTEIIEHTLGRVDIRMSDAYYALQLCYCALIHATASIEDKEAAAVRRRGGRGGGAHTTTAASHMWRPAGAWYVAMKERTNTLFL
jgi:hypothetical protein